MNISFSLTKPQFRNKTKTVTRRLGWKNVKPGQVLQGVEKQQGLKKGEHVRPMGMIRVKSVRREPLRRLILQRSYGKREVIKEGFPNMTPEEFVRFFLATHKRVTLDTDLTRIEYEYLQ